MGQLPFSSSPFLFLPSDCAATTPVSTPPHLLPDSQSFPIELPTLGRPQLVLTHCCSQTVLASVKTLCNNLHQPSFILKGPEELPTVILSLLLLTVTSFRLVTPLKMRRLKPWSSSHKIWR